MKYFRRNQPIYSLGNSTVQTKLVTPTVMKAIEAHERISHTFQEHFCFFLVSKTNEKGCWRIKPCHSTWHACQSLIRDRQILTRPESVLFSFSFSSSVTKIWLLNMNVYATAFFISSLVQARIGSGTDHQLCVYVPIRIQTYRTPYRFDLYA